MFGSSDSGNRDNKRYTDTGGGSGFNVAAGDDVGLNNSTVIMTDSGATRDALQGMDRATSRAVQGIQNVVGTAFQFGESTANNAFALSANALKQNKDLAMSAMAQSERATQGAMEKVYQSSKPDKSTQDQLIKAGMIVLGIAAVAVAVGSVAK